LVSTDSRWQLSA